MDITGYLKKKREVIFTNYTKTFTKFQRILESSVCLFLNDTERITKHILNYTCAIISQNNNVQVIKMIH